MFKRRHLVPLALLLTLFGCGGSTANMKAKEYKGHFEDAKQGLIFQCPTSWDIRENVEGHRVIARSPLEKDKSDKFQENLILSGPVAAASLDEVRAQAEADYKKLDHYQSLAAPADILDFDYQFNGQDLHSRVYLNKIRDKNEYWLVQFTDAKADFPGHEAAFVGIMATWGLQPGASPTPIVNGPPASATPVVTQTPAATATPVATATPAATTPTPAPAASATPK